MKAIGRHLFTVLRIAVGVGLLYYLGRSGVIDWSAVGRLFRAWPVTSVAFLLLLVDMAVTAYRLVVLLRPLGLHLSAWDSTRLLLIGNFFNACLPGATGGDLIKIYYAAEGNRGKRMEVATAIILDRAVGMFGMMIWPLGAALFFPELIARLPVLQALLAGAALVGVGMLIGYWICRAEWFRRSRWMEWILAKLPLGGYARRILDTLYAYRGHSGALLLATAISLLAHTMSAGITMLCAYAMHPESFAWEMSVLIPLGHLANIVPLTPGGLGVGEAAFNQLFSMAGLTGGAEAMIGWRILYILSGLVGLVFYMQGRKKFVHAAQAAADAENSDGGPQPAVR